MATPKLSIELAEQIIATVNKCIDDGFKIGGSPSAKEEAARRLRIPGPTCSSRLRAARHTYGLEPKKATKSGRLDVPEGDTAAQLESRRVGDELNSYKLRCAELERQLIASNEWRSSIMGLASTPNRSRLVIPSKKSNPRGGRSVVLHLSDIHYGETVSLDEMDGANKYDGTYIQL